MKRLKNRRAFTLLVIAALVISGALVIHGKKTAMERIPPAKTYGMVVPVRTAVAGNIRLTVPYLAEVRSDTDVDLASKVTARVNSIVASGTQVKTGDVLVRLENGDLLAKREGLALKIKEVGHQIDAKKADIESLKSTHQRSLQLRDIQAVSQELLDTEAARIVSTAATIESMKINAAALKQNIREIDDTLSYTTLKSPLDGIVSKTFVAEGGIASGGKPLLSLSGSEGKQFIVRVSDSILPTTLLHKGQPCQLHSLNSTYHGLNEYSCQTQTNLSAGNRAEVKLIVYTGNDILLPSNAVLQRDGKQVVLVVHDDQATPRPVTIVAEGSEGLIVKGIEAGDEYVVAKPDILLKLLAGVAVIRADT